MASIVNFDAGKVFSGQESKKMIPGWDAPGPHTPATNPNYVFPKWVYDIVAWLMYSKEPLYIFGPVGVGKTSLVKQVVAKLNYPVYEVTGHNRLEFPEMVGHHTVEQGSMRFVYGPLAMAMKHGGLFMVNEIDLLDPSTAAGLNSVLDGYPLTIPENAGEIIYPHPMFKFVATANSNGGGDQTGYYQGVLRQNLAFQDRFMMVEATYLEPATEKSILQKMYPTLPEDIADRMIKYATAVRKLFVGEQTEDFDTTIEVTFSTRTLLRWAMLTTVYEPLKHKGVDVVSYALDRALLLRASEVTKVTLREIYQRLFGGN